MLEPVLLQIKRFLQLILIYSFLRCLFYIYNYSQFSKASLIEVLKAFVVGLRFDTSAILLLNLPFFLLALLPFLWRSSLWKPIESVIFYFLNGIFFIFNYGDLEFYKFTGKRLTWDVFKIGQDLKNTGFEILVYYWFIAVLYLITFYLWIKWRPQFSLEESNKANKIKSSYLFFGGLFYLLLIVIGARGGLQLKPLKPLHAGQWVSSSLIPLTLNSTFTLLKTPSTDEIPIFHFDLSESEVRALQKQWRASYPLHPQKSGAIQNVMIILLESFALEYMGSPHQQGQGYTPFLDTLAKESLFFENAFANGRRSIEVLPSVLCGLPSLMNEPFITSPYQQNHLLCLPQILKEKGYSTHFFHGAENGSMFFDSFTKRIGVDHYYGLNEYGPVASGDMNIWGVHDEPFFKYTVEKLKQVQKPFFSVLFSLSSHHPYKIPDRYQGQFNKGTLEIHESIGYTDHSLKELFHQLQQQPWYSKTLFVITADHTQKKMRPEYNDPLGSYRVPLLFYFPGGWQGAVNEVQKKVVQHADIAPSILNLLGEQDSPFPFGHSITHPRSQVINGSAGFYWYLSQETYIEYNGSQFQFYDYNPQTWQRSQDSFRFKESEIPSDLRWFQWTLQKYSEGMSKNQLYKISSKL